MMVNIFCDLQANSHAPPIQPQARIWKSHMANAIPCLMVNLYVHHSSSNESNLSMDLHPPKAVFWPHRQHLSPPNFGRFGTGFSPPVLPWPSPAARPSASAAGAPDIGAGPRGSAFLGGSRSPFRGGAMGSPWRADPEWIHRFFSQHFPAKMLGWGLKLGKTWWIFTKKKWWIAAGELKHPRIWWGKWCKRTNQIMDDLGGCKQVECGCHEERW